MPRAPRPERIDEDAPEATAEWFAKARPAGEVLADLLGNEIALEMLKPERGRSAFAQEKADANIRLDAGVVSALKDSGAGWKTLIN